MVLEHQGYLEAVRDLTDWLMTAGEELQHWSDTSGDSAYIRKKLSKVKVTKAFQIVAGIFHHIYCGKISCSGVKVLGCT